MAVSVIIICETRGLIWRLGHTLPRLFCLRFQLGDYGMSVLFRTPGSCPPVEEMAWLGPLWRMHLEIRKRKNSRAAIF